jgi:DNA-binding transcriptional ArsR family regulator
MKSCCSLENLEVKIPDQLKREIMDRGGFEKICHFLSASAINKLVEPVKIIGDEKRLTILYALSQQRMCVCMLAELTGCTYSKCSYHIAKLKDTGFIEAEHLGNYIIYSLTSYGKKVLDLLSAMDEVDR